jgi:plastocyanin domain-containing protein
MHRRPIVKKLLALIIFILMSFPYATLKAETEEYVAAVDADGVQRVRIMAAAYHFTPDKIVLKVNIPVELSVKREAGITPHNITTEAPGAGIEFSESLGTDPVIIKFRPTKAGRFAFFCNKKLPFSKSHREKGMEGILEVRE